MKRFMITGIAVLTAFSLLAGCAGRETEEVSAPESSQSSQDSSQQSGKVYTEQEAASNNAKISAADVKLVQFDTPEVGGQKAVIKTNMGSIEVILFPKQAPKAVENFVTHAKNGYYTGLEFNKVLNNFIMEGGDPDGQGGDSIFTDETGKPIPFENEYSLDLWHFRGAVSMSNFAGEGENGSRFFIVQAPFVDDEILEEMGRLNYPGKVMDKYAEIGGTPGFDAKRTVFGMVTESSLDVIDAIARVPVDDSGVPVDTVLIESVTIKTIVEELDDDDKVSGASSTATSSSK